MTATPRRNIIRVNSSTADDQQNPAIAIDERGNFVVVWQSDSEEDGEEILARFFLPNGTAFAPEFLVNNFQEGDQERPAIGADAFGNIVTAWQAEDQGDAGSGIFAQRYQFGNEEVFQLGSEFRVNTATEGRQQNPDVAFGLSTDSTDDELLVAPQDFVVVWQNDGRTTNRVIGRDESGYGVFAQRYSNTGAPQGRAFLVNTTTRGDQINPAVAKDASGNFVVVWQSRNRGNGFDIFGQRFDSLGQPLGDQFQVNTFVRGSQINPDVTADASGNFVIVWQDERQDGDGSGIYARRYDRRGNPRNPGDQRINSTTDGDQETPSIGSDERGNYTVVWASDRGDNTNIIGHQFGSNGRRIASEFQVNRDTDNDQTRPEIAVRPNGNFVVAWQSDEGDDRDTDILARQYTVSQSSNGGGTGSGNGRTGGNGGGTESGNGGNGSGNGNGGDDGSVSPPPRSLRVRTASDSLTGKVIVGTAGDDLLRGGKGNDRLIGRQGRDRFVIGTGLGTETIVDFQSGRDALVLKGNLQPEDLTLVQRGSNVVIQADDRTLAVLRGVNLTSDIPFI